MDDVRAFARAADGTETDITEGVQALYDLVIGSMDWGSGFWTAEDAAPVAKLARLLGFKKAEEAERYLREQLHSEEQMRFYRDHQEEVSKFRVEAGRMYPVAHDHVFSSVGKCLWPQCGVTSSLPPGPARSSRR